MAISKITNSGIGAIDTLAVDTDTLYVDSANNRVGVGTASPSGANLEIFTGSTTADGLKINRYATGVYYSTLRQDTHGLAIRVGDGSTIAERVAITPNGLTFNGDTAAANALDDYEEGTWTPQIWKNTTQVTSPTTAVGVYRKVGSLLFLSFYFYKSSGSNTDNNAWELRGLPFSILHSSSSGYTSLTAGYTGINSTNYFDQAGSHRWQANGSTYLALYGPQQTTQWSTGYLEFAGYGFLYTS